MASIIGTDEAGYGPNLGPLTITGTLWRAPSPDVCLYQALEGAVSPTATTDRATIADSKSVYQSTGSLKRLETSVLAMLNAMTGNEIRTWQELLEVVTHPDSISQLACESWLDDGPMRLPVEADATEIGFHTDRIRLEFETNHIELLKVHCEIVMPARFNEGVEQVGNKASLLTSTTLNLVRGLCELSDDPLKISCDKHGGRSRYMDALLQHLTEQWVRIEEESLDRSGYSWVEDHRRISAEFIARGESQLPVALASMVSKYIRELMMKMWNEFWQIHLPHLKPTKGYPVDAKRFKAEIAEQQARLGIEDHSIWRCR